MNKITKKLPLGSGTPRLLIFILCLLLLFNLLLCVLVALVTMKHTIKISAKPKRPFSSFIPLSGSPDFSCITLRYSSHLTCSWSLSATRYLCHIQTRLQLDEEGSRCQHGWPPGQLGVGSSACHQRLRAESEPFHTCPGVESKPPPCPGEVGCLVWAASLGEWDWYILPADLQTYACWSEWPIRSLEGLGLAKDGMSLFPGPQGRLLRSGPEATTEHDEASQIFLQVGLICLLGE